MSLFKKNLIDCIKFSMIAGLITIGSFNFGRYTSRKSYLINEAIRGRGSKVLTLIEKNRNEEKLVYKTSLEKAMDSVFLGDFAAKLAEKRFKSRKFDEIIRKYRLDYHNNS